MGMAWNAARGVGLKLMLCALSLGAAAASVHGAPEQSLAEATWGGMKLLHLILGMMGSGASLFFLPQLTPKWLGATVTCGIVCALTGTPLCALLASEYLLAGKPLPGPAENLLAVSMGVGGVYIIPAVMKLWAIVRNDPLAIVRWVLSWRRVPIAPDPGASEDHKGVQP
jgi:hypothetical protein